MKILVITNHYWPEEFKITELAENLVAKGHEVTVMSGIPNYPAGKFFPGYGLFSKRKEEKNGVKIHRMPLIPRCLLYTSPSPRDQRGSRMPSSA